jgi:hypothetical protein
MHKSATKCNKTIGKWCKNKHGASKIIDTLETYQLPLEILNASNFLQMGTHTWLVIDNVDKVSEVSTMIE